MISENTMLNDHLKIFYLHLAEKEAQQTEFSYFITFAFLFWLSLYCTKYGAVISVSVSYIQTSVISALSCFCNISIYTQMRESGFSSCQCYWHWYSLDKKNTISQQDHHTASCYPIFCDEIAITVMKLPICVMKLPISVMELPICTDL